MWGKANVFFWAVIGMSVWPTVDTVAPAIEGRLFPVVARASLTNIVPTGQVVSAINGETVKRRNCDFVSINWFLGRPTQPSARVSVDFLEGTKVRALGRYEFGPWKVAIPAELIATGSYAIAVHSCHPFWNTESLFYAPPEFPS